MDHGLVENARILVPRFDVRLPQNYAPEGNAVIKKTMKEIVTYVQRNYGTKPEYVLVKEKSRDGGYHYNGIMLLDNSKIKSPVKIIEKMEEIIDRATGVANRNGTDNQGLVELCKNPMIVHRNNEQERADVLYRASYLAKLKDKEDSGREVFCSKTR